jgi:DNA primase catalytic core
MATLQPLRAINTNRWVDLGRLLDDEIIPRLSAEVLFDHPAHKWHKGPKKWQGGCPWHDSKSGTSFYINPTTKSWRCPGCGVSGGAVQYFFKRLRNDKDAPSPRGADFIEVVKALAKMAGVVIPDQPLDERASERARLRETRRDILQSVSARCQEWLESEHGKYAREYMAGRGFSVEDCRELGLGLYPPVAELEAMLQVKQFAAEDVRACGVLSRKMEGYVTFPWHDDRDNLLTLYGKLPLEVIPEGQKKTLALYNPKGEDGQDWEHTKNSPLYLNRALKDHHRDLVLVEGLTDAALPHLRGDTRVVACVAAEFSHDQIKTLTRRGIRSVTIALDPDAGGDSGILSNVRRLREVGITPYVAPRLPEGQDPDDFIQAHGMDAWRAHIDQRKHAYHYLADRLIEAQGDHREGDDAWSDEIIRKAVDFARPLPASHLDELLRHFWPRIAEATGSTVDALIQRANTEQTKTKAEGKAKDGADEWTVNEGDEWTTQEITIDDVATIDDLIKAGASIKWLWKGWLQEKVMVVVFSDAGVGKTRFIADLTRRIRHQLPWPDGRPMNLPSHSKILWIPCDNNHDELATLAQEYDIVENICLNADKSDPYGGTLLDTPQELANLEARIKAVQPVFVVIDTIGNSTDKDMCRQEEVKKYFQPFQVLARRHNTVIMVLAHTSRQGTLYGRHAVAKVRLSIRLSNPDPEGQPDRRRLEVVKSNAKLPPALGVTMTNEGNFYDDKPPYPPDQEPTSQARTEKETTLLKQCREWLTGWLQKGAQPVGVTRTEAEAKGFSAKTLYTAKDYLDVEQYSTGGKKWWRLSDQGAAAAADTPPQADPGAYTTTENPPPGDPEDTPF